MDKQTTPLNETLQQEIRKRKRAEAALRECQRVLSTLTSNLPGMAYRCRNDRDWTMESVSQGCLALTGYPPADLVGNQKIAYGQLIHPDDQDAVWEEVQAALQEERAFQIIYRIITAAGEEKWVWEQGQGIISAEGELLALEGFIADITEQKQTKEKLWASQELHRFLADYASDMISRHTPEGVYLYASPACRPLLGYEPKELVGRSAYDFFHPQDLAAIKKSHQTILETPNTYTVTYRIRRQDGAYIWFETNSQTIRHPDTGQVQEIISVSRDVTERIRAREELQRRNQELELLNWIITAAHADLEPETTLETACRELGQVFDLPYATALLLNGQTTTLTVAAEYAVIGSDTSVADGQSPELPSSIPMNQSPSFQYLMARKASLVVEDAQSDARVRPGEDLVPRSETVSFLMIPLMITGEVRGALSLEAAEPRQFLPQEINLAWNVADQIAGRLARIKLDEERRLLSTAVEQTAESVIITNTDNVIVYVNPTFERITGYSRAEAIGQKPHLLLDSGHQEPAFYEKLWATIRDGQVWQGRFVNKKKDGTLFTEDATVTPVREESGAIINYVTVKRDVTRELELEKQYYQAQKMEAVGRLTAGVAHDFNNLLTVINGFSEMVQGQLSPEDPLQEMIGKVLASGQRATHLVRQLLAFSRKQIIEPRVLDLNQVVTEMEMMLQRTIGEDILIKAHLTPDLWPVKLDPTQLEQIIVNLAVNARDAMPEGGRLTIETDNDVLDKDYVTEHFETQPGEYVRLTISDTGMGMSEAVRSRIFEPFFTTKEQGKGTGLGLATVFGIVKQNKGHIWVYSEEGHGTTFKIYLPRSQKQATVSPRPEVKSDERHRGTERILVVEDEELVRELTSKVLRTHGHTVLAAANGQEALRLVQDHSQAIDLLVTDVIMPEMGGRALVEALSILAPDIKILFTSGYSDEAIVQHGVLEPGVAFLQKPFSPSALVRKVREVLDSKG